MFVRVPKSNAFSCKHEKSTGFIVTFRTYMIHGLLRTLCSRNPGKHSNYALSGCILMFVRVPKSNAFSCKHEKSTGFIVTFRTCMIHGLLRTLCSRNPTNIQSPPYRAPFSCLFGSQSHAFSCKHETQDFLTLVSYYILYTVLFKYTTY